VLARSKDSSVPAALIASPYIALGDKDQAFEWLGKGLEERGENIVWLGTDPLFDPLAWPWLNPKCERRLAGRQGFEPR
jgi:hypothetical protein